MGQFLEDQLKADKYFNCTASIRYPKETILELAIEFFHVQKSNKVLTHELCNYLKDRLDINRLSLTALSVFLQADRFADFNKVADIYEKLSGEK